MEPSFHAPFPVAVMPDGRPAPLVLTETELARLLRLDEPGGPKKPSETLRRYREQGLLRGCKIGNRVRYPIVEVLRFLAVKVSADGKKNLPGGRA